MNANTNTNTTVNTSVNTTVNTEDVNISEPVKAEITNIKLVHTLDKVDKDTIITAIKKVDEIGAKAIMFKALLISTMIKYYGDDGKKLMAEKTTLDMNTINAYALTCDKFITYKMPYYMDETNKDSNGKSLMKMDENVIENVSACKGEIYGLEDKDGYPLSWTVLYTVRNLPIETVNKLIEEGKLTWKTTQAKAKEVIKPYTKSTKGKGNSNSNKPNNDDKPITLSAMKKDIDKIQLMIKILNSLSDTVKGNKKHFPNLAKELTFFAETLADTKEDAQDAQDAQDSTQEAQDAQDSTQDAQDAQ